MADPLAGAASHQHASPAHVPAQPAHAGPSTLSARSISRPFAPAPMALVGSTPGSFRSNPSTFPHSITSHAPSSLASRNEHPGTAISSTPSWAHSPLVAEYVVSTATTKISDLRIQVCLPPSDATTASSSSVERPVWFKERTLGGESDSILGDEIVDNLIDANTGKVKWSTARPLRGWYLHLRSPQLPPKTAIPLRASRVLQRAKPATVDVSATPLELVVGSRLDRQALRRCACHMPARTQLQPCTSSKHERQDRKSGFEDVPLSTLETTIDARHQASDYAERVDRSMSRHSATTSVDLGMGRISAESHVRKRSAGGSALEMGESLGGPSGHKQSGRETGSRNPSASKAPKDVHMVPEEPESGQVDEAPKRKVAPSSTILVRPPSANGHTSHDRPYEPALPRSLSTAQANGPNRSHLDALSIGSNGRDAKPSKCTFVLLDGSGADAQGWERMFGRADLQARPASAAAAAATATTSAAAGTSAGMGTGADADVEMHKRNTGAAVSSSASWARWAWNMIPVQIRPSLSLDSSKSFTIRWIDAPLSPTSHSTFADHHHQQHDEAEETEEEGGTNGRGDGQARSTAAAAGGGSDGVAAQPGLQHAVELLRFEDLTPLWLGAKTRGRLSLQMHAVRAVGLETDFWIQVALSYLDFLEERDGYHAAYDG